VCGVCGKGCFSCLIECCCNLRVNQGSGVLTMPPRFAASSGPLSPAVKENRTQRIGVNNGFVTPSTLSGEW